MRNTTFLLAGVAGLSLALAACETTDDKAVSTTTTTERSTSTADGETSTTTQTTTTADPAATMPAADAGTTTSTTQTTTTSDPAMTGAAPATTTTTQTTTTNVTKVATQADVKVGAPVSDSTGESFAKVEKVESDGITIRTGAVRAKLPYSSVGVGPSGLVVGVTKAEIVAAAAKAGN